MVNNTLARCAKPEFKGEKGKMQDILMVVLDVVILAAVIAGIIVAIVISRKKRKKLKEAGVVKKRDKDFYKYGYFFQLRNADFARVGNAMMQVRDLKLAELLSVSTNPNMLVLREPKYGHWEAQIELLDVNQGQYIYYFHFTKSYSTNGSLQYRTQMNSSFTLFENIMYQCDPNLTCEQKTLDIQKSHKTRIRVRLR